MPPRKKKSEPIPGSANGATIAAQEVDYLKLLKDIEEKREAVWDVVKAHKNPSANFKLDSGLSKLTDDDLDKMWTSCNVYLSEAIIACIGTGSKSADFQREVPADAIGLMDSIVLIARSTVELFPKVDPEQPNFNPRKIPDGLVHSVSMLNGLISSLPETHDQVRNNIAKLCESWYLKGLPDKESLVTNCLVYLLNRTLATAKATKSDVKRVHVLHASLLTQNFQSASTEKLRSLLLRAAQAHIYLRCPEGIRFISFLFSVSPSFIGSLHQSIKQALPGLTKELAKAYGEVYFKAWSASAGTFRQRIEELCIQDLMLRGVLANRTLPKSRHVFAPVFHILNRFNDERNCRETQATMADLWEPILWRHLSVANEYARCNAAEFFLAGFPIENPNVELEIRAAQQDQQMEMMLKLFDDETPEVRIVAVDGVCKLLAKLWQIISSEDINRLFKVMIHELAFDASSPKVRQAVLKGMQHLVAECPRSHLYLKEILPRLSKCLEDVNDTVRVAMLDLLLAIKKVKLIKFWDISPLEDLLYRLADEKKVNICQKIVLLLFPSFFPLNLKEEAKIERSIVMIQKNRLASRKFFQHIHKFSTLPQCVIFMLSILVNLKRFVKFHLSSQSESVKSFQDSSIEVCDEDKENNCSQNPPERSRSQLKEVGPCGDNKRSSSRSTSLDTPTRSTSSDTSTRSTSSDTSLADESNTSIRSDNTSIQETRNLLENRTFAEAFEDPTVVTALLDIVCIIWVAQSNQLAKQENLEFLRLLEKKSAGILSILFKFYKSDDVCRTIIYMCSFLPQSSVTTVASFCIARVRTAKLPTETLSMTPKWNDTSEVFDASDPTSTYIDSLCNWRRSDDLLEMVHRWIINDVENRQRQFQKPSPRKRSITRKGVRFADDCDPSNPKLALVILKYILRHQVNKRIVLKKNLPQLKEIGESLKTYIPLIRNHLSIPAPIDEDTELLLLHAWDSMLKVNLLLQLQDNENQSLDQFLTFLQNLLAWAVEESPSLARGNRLAQYVISSMLQLTSNLMLMDMADGKFVGDALEVAMRLLESVGDLSCIKMVSSLVKDTCKWSARTDDKNVGIIYTVALPELTRTLITCLSRLNPSEAFGLQDVKKDFQSILVTFRVEFYGPLLSRDILRPILEQILKGISDNIKTGGNYETVSTTKDLPFLPGFLLDVVLFKSTVMLPMIIEWKEFISQPQFEPNLIDISAHILLVKCVSNFNFNPIRSELASILLVLERHFELSCHPDDETSEASSAENSLEEVVSDVIKLIKTNLQIVSN